MHHEQLSRRLGVIAFVVPILLASAALADGGYWPERAVPARPAIPAQRAIIVFRDNAETLIVESAFAGQGATVGWVLPLPAEPTGLAVADPGVLSSMSILTPPEITHDLWEEIRALLWLLAILAASAIVCSCSKPVTVSHLLDFLLVAFLFLIAAAVLLPSLGTAGVSINSASVVVKSSQRVGSYDVTVLRAKDATGLTDWLAGNGFKALDEKARPVVDDYVARGWCFLVARLANSSPGQPSQPHPLQVKFPASQPVYPMKLTGLAGTNTNVELYVIANGEASAGGFHVALAQWCPRLVHGRYQLIMPGSAPESVDQPHFEAGGRYSAADNQQYLVAGYNIHIGQPDIVGLMWDGCVLTKLTADLSPEAMNSDVVLGLGELHPHRDHVYSERGRRETVICVLLIGLCILVVMWWMVHSQHRPGRYQLRLLGAAAIVVAIACLIFYLATGPVIAVNGMRGSAMIRAHYFELGAENAMQELALNAGMTDRELAALPKLLVDAKICKADDPILTNPFTAEPVRMERSPGNFSVHREDGKVWLCFYDPYGQETSVELPPPGQTSQREKP